MKFELLGDIANVRTGKYDANHGTLDGPYKFYTCAFGQFKAPTYSFEGEAIVLPGNGANVGEVFFNEGGKFEAYQRTYVVENIKAHPKYIYMYFKSFWKDSLKNTQYGSATNYIRMDNLTKFKIPLPPLPEQIRIAEILSQAESLIAQRKQSISLLDELLKSTFLEMFGDPMKNEKKWEIQSLGHISNVGSSKRVFVEELGDDGIPFFRGTEIGKLAEGINIIPTLFITKSHYEQLKTHTGIPKVGDLLMPSICPDGRIWRIIDEKPFYFKDGRVLWISLKNSKINGTYLQCVLKEIFKSNYNNIASGTTFAELKIFALKNIKTPIPPIELQIKFANIVEKVEILKAQYQQSLTELQNMYGVLSQKAFRGGLSLDKKKETL